MNRSTIKRLSVFAVLVFLVSVGSVMADDPAIKQMLFAPAVYETTGCTTTVNAGQSIQAAINNAQNGAVICVRGGTYNEQLQIKPAQSGITVQAYSGETPVIDGQGTIPSTSGNSKYMGLIHITASNVTVQGFEVRNSNVRGIVVAQPSSGTSAIQNVTVRNNVIRGSQDGGINVNGNTTYQPRNILIENNAIYENLQKNADGHTGGSALAFVEVANSVARGNTIYRNLGEGLVADRWTTNLTFENNVIYDNVHANLYLSTTQNPVVQRNLIFCTEDRNFWRGSGALKPPPGLIVRDENYEGQSVTPPASNGQVIINNIVVGCGNNFMVSTQLNGGGLNNAVVANNSFINARGDQGAGAMNLLFEGDASFKNSRFVNNLILQSEPSGQIARILLSLGDPDFSSFTAANNLYSSAPTKNWLNNEPGRIVADPKLNNPAMPTRNGGVPNAAGYGLQSGSPAINAGTTANQVTVDFFGQARSGALDVGADEQGGGTGSTPGRIIVTLATTPDRSTQAFGFTANYVSGGFQLTDGQEHNSGQIATGTYNVALTAVSGWTATSSCSDGSSAGSIALAEGETVTCTFTVEQQTQPTTRIVIRKETIPAGDPQGFQFTSNFAGSFQLFHGGQKVTDLNPGTYSVSEAAIGGWEQVSASCSDGSQVDAIDLGQGETVTCTFSSRKEGGGGGEVTAGIYVTTFVAGTVGGVDYSVGDILAYDGLNDSWSLYFDGSDVGIKKPINEFELLDDGSILLALNGKVNLSGAAGSFALQMQDVARFIPTSTGADTAGSFELYFDGSDVALSKTSEKIDALARKSDGTLLISTFGAAVVLNGTVSLKGQDEDLLSFGSIASLGNMTAGTWAVPFDGSTVPGLKGEDVTAAWYDNATGDVYLTVMDDFVVGGVSGTNRTVLRVTPSGAVSAYWDAAAAGLPGPVDGLHIIP